MDVKMEITFYFFIIFFISILIVGCKPDNLEIEIYTSDIESASEGEVVEVPLKATFRLMGEDKENQLPLAKEVALKYMPNHYCLVNNSILSVNYNRECL